MTETRWYKGNIHTHTDLSDGDAKPEVAVRWYRDHEYDFLVLSDHNHLTLYEHSESDSGSPLMVPGEEVTINLLKPGKEYPILVPVHIIAIGIDRVVEPINTGDVVTTLQANIDAIAEAGGISSIAHPNFKWAFDHREISAVTGAACMEIFTPASNVDGAPGRYSTEQMWDNVLSAGRPIWGVAVDDTHHYFDFAPGKYNPGKGWIVVRAAELSQDAIVGGIERGDFYASTGVELDELEIDSEGIRLRVRKNEDWEYVVTFTGRGGATFGQIAGTDATYRFRGDEGYIRATVTCSNPVKAWTQPAFLGA